MKYRKISVAITVVSLLIIILTGCSSNSNISDKDTEKPYNDLQQPYSHPKYEDLPEEIQKWIDSSQRIFIGQALERDGKLYILVTYGQKATGGYKVEIKNVEEQKNSLDVTVEFTDPAPDQNVTEALTFPYDLIEIEPCDKKINFIPKGSQKYIPGLLGIEKVEPIAVGKDVIMVFEPSPNAVVGNEILFRGIANTFEGTVNYVIKTPDNDDILEGYTTGSMGDWGYFEKKIKIPSGTAADLIMEVFVYSAKDGEKENIIKIPLTWVEYDK